MRNVSSVRNATLLLASTVLLLFLLTRAAEGISRVIPIVSHSKHDTLFDQALFRSRGGSETETASHESSTLDSKSDTEEDADKPYQFSLYQPGDGSDSDPDKIPWRFLSMQKGHREAAKAALETTLRWRQEHGIDTILQRPHPNFDIYKSMSVHIFLGRDATGHVVFFQRPAMDAGRFLKLAKKNDIELHDLIMHYAWCMEYCWNLLDPPPSPSNNDNDSNDDSSSGDQTLTSIIDLTGLDLSILRRRELLSFVKQFVTMTSTHYPQRGCKTLILNAPHWFENLYRLISPLLRESTKAKVQILSRGTQHQVDVLHEVLGEDLLQYLPPELLSTDYDYKKNSSREGKNSESDNNGDSTTLSVTPMEQELREFALARLQEAGMEMNTLKE